MRGAHPHHPMSNLYQGGRQTKGHPTRATPPPGVRRQLALQLRTTTRPTRSAARMELLRTQPPKHTAHPTPPRHRPRTRPRLGSDVSTMQRHQSQHLRPAPPPTHHRNTQHDPPRPMTMQTTMHNHELSTMRYPQAQTVHSLGISGAGGGCGQRPRPAPTNPARILLAVRARSKLWKKL